MKHFSIADSAHTLHMEMLTRSSSTDFRLFIQRFATLLYILQFACMLCMWQQLASTQSQREGSGFKFDFFFFHAMTALEKKKKKEKNMSDGPLQCRSGKGLPSRNMFR